MMRALLGPFILGCGLAVVYSAQVKQNSMAKTKPITLSQNDNPQKEVIISNADKVGERREASTVFMEDNNKDAYDDEIEVTDANGNPIFYGEQRNGRLNDAERRLEAKVKCTCSRTHMPTDQKMKTPCLMSLNDSPVNGDTLYDSWCIIEEQIENCTVPEFKFQIYKGNPKTASHFGLASFMFQDAWPKKYGRWMAFPGKTCNDWNQGIKKNSNTWITKKCTCSRTHEPTKESSKPNTYKPCVDNTAAPPKTNDYDYDSWCFMQEKKGTCIVPIYKFTYFNGTENHLSLSESLGRLKFKDGWTNGYDIKFPDNKCGS